VRIFQSTCDFFFRQDPVENLKSGFDEKNKIKVRFEISNHGLVDPEQVFNHDHDRGEKFSIRV